MVQMNEEETDRLSASVTRSEESKSSRFCTKFACRVSDDVSIIVGCINQPRHITTHLYSRPEDWERVLSVQTGVLGGGINPRYLDLL